MNFANTSYELRQYKVLPGKIDEWVKIMEAEIIPF